MHRLHDVLRFEETSARTSTSMFISKKLPKHRIVFRDSINRLENIANVHREHAVLFFLNIVQNIEVDVFSKLPAKNRIAKNWKTLHR